MTSLTPQFSHEDTNPPRDPSERFRIMQRQPRRISITLSYQVFQTLLNRSEEEGRSMSNLCAFLLEEVLHQQAPAAAPAEAPVVQPGVMNRAQLRFSPYTPQAAPTPNGAFH